MEYVLWEKGKRYARAVRKAFAPSLADAERILKPTDGQWVERAEEPCDTHDVFVRLRKHSAQ